MIIDNTERERGKEKKLDTVCLAVRGREPEGREKQRVAISTSKKNRRRVIRKLLETRERGEGRTGDA